jgi:hypothetical protein
MLDSGLSHGRQGPTRQASRMLQDTFRSQGVPRGAYSHAAGFLTKVRQCPTKDSWSASYGTVLTAASDRVQTCSVARLLPPRDGFQTPRVPVENEVCNTDDSFVSAPRVQVPSPMVLFGPRPCFLDSPYDVGQVPTLDGPPGRSASGVPRDRLPAPCRGRSGRAAHTFVEVTGYRDVSVPLYRIGDLEDLLEHPAIDWESVRAIKAG